MTDAPLVSVVMPVYGTEAYVAQAIAAVQMQSLRDWELIVVDDCTPDGAADIARDFASKDERIRVVSHQTNQGLSAARNTGIAEARGTWVWMPDSDDTYEFDLLQRAMDAVSAADAPIDVVLFGYVEDYVDERGRFLHAHELPMEEACYETPDMWHRLVPRFEQQTHYGYAWNKLWRLDRIREKGLRFENVRLIEDFLFSSAYLDDALGMVVLGGTPYRYMKRKGRSLTGANAFSSEEYWRVHVRRIQTLVDQLKGWEVFDDEARAVVGSLYVRFVVSALERTHFPGESWTHAQRCAWLDEQRTSALYQELVPYAASHESRVVELAIRALRSDADQPILLVAWATYMAHRYAYDLFTKLRSGR